MANETVVVGCKIPNGLIIRHGGKSALLNGSNSSQIIGGHGITNDVDKELFEAWLDVHADAVYVRRGLVFANSSIAATKKEAFEKEGEESIEPIDPENPGDEIEPVPQGKDTE